LFHRGKSGHHRTVTQADSVSHTSNILQKEIKSKAMSEQSGAYKVKEKSSMPGMVFREGTMKEEQSGAQAV
jgi:hypothetical protein